MELTLLFGTFFLSFTITFLVRNVVLKNNKLDIPNHRSSHKEPTPSGGGLGIVISFFLSLVYLWLNQQVHTNHFIAMLGLSIVAIIGFIDDYYPVSARLRLLIHFIAAIWVCTFVGSILSETGVSPIIEAIIYIITILYLVWLLNLYNFMDGIDGIASAQGLTVCFGAILLLLIKQQPQTFPVLAVLSISILGFVIWNWPPAKIFMGDVSSGFIGILIATISIITNQEQSLSIFSWLILMAVFISDATITLISRLLNRENIVQSHNSHAYQILCRHYGHKLVVQIVIVINVFYLLPLAYLAETSDLWTWVSMALAYMSLTIAIVHIRKKHAIQKSYS